MRNNLRWTILIPILLLFGTGATVVWSVRPAAPMPEALAALQSDAGVHVETSPWLTFQPEAADFVTGFIFYPGGLVDPRAYAPMAHQIAAQGNLVVIVPMPLNLAFFDSARAQDVIRAYPAIRQWAIGGHSLGGVAAAMFISGHPDAVRGLALWAAYPSDADNLSALPLKVISISGTADALSTPAKIAVSQRLLPATTRWVAIEGGNHGQFGWYGLQNGDGVATISREHQQEQIVTAMADFLAGLNRLD